jgi:hypothetical protein
MAVVEVIGEQVGVEVSLLFLASSETVILPEDLWGQPLLVGPVSVGVKGVVRDFRKAHDLLLASSPSIARDGSFEELGFLADGVFMDRELTFLFPYKNDDEVVVIVLVTR